jgi:hypothetical protein
VFGAIEEKGRYGECEFVRLEGWSDCFHALTAKSLWKHIAFLAPRSPATPERRNELIAGA